MNSLRMYIYGALALAAIALLGWGQQQRIRAADGQTEIAQAVARAAVLAAQESLALSDTLNITLKTERAAQADLRTQQGQLRTQLATRQRTIEELKRENQDLREWADQLLPDAARRLRERPALTGAAAYRDWLSGRSAVPVARDSAAQ